MNNNRFELLHFHWLIVEKRQLTPMFLQTKGEDKIKIKTVLLKIDI